MLHPGAAWAESEGAVGYVVLRLSCTCHSEPLCTQSWFISWCSVLHLKERRTADTELSLLSVSTLPFCLTCEMGLQDSYKIFFVTCDEFSSLSQPYSKALCHFFFFPSCLNPFDKTMIGNRRLALCELVHRNLSSPSPGNQGVKMTDMDAPSMIEH